MLISKYIRHFPQHAFRAVDSTQVYSEPGLVLTNGRIVLLPVHLGLFNLIKWQQYYRKVNAVGKVMVTVCMQDSHQHKLMQ